MAKSHICSRERCEQTEKSLNTILQDRYSFCGNHFHRTDKSQQVIVKIFPVKKVLYKCWLWTEGEFGAEWYGFMSILFSCEVRADWNTYHVVIEFYSVSP